MRKCGGFFASIVLAGALSVPLAAAPDARAMQKETPPPTVAVHQVSVPYLGLRHELAMLIAGTTLLVVAAIVRRAG